MLAKIVTATLLAGLCAGSAQASSVWEKGHPRSAAEVLTMYPDAVKLRDGVYDVKRGERGRIYLFGASGEQYRLEALQKFRRMAARTPDVDAASLAGMDQTIAATQRSLKAKQRMERERGGSLLKHTEFYDEQMCGHYVDVYVSYIDGWTNSQAYAWIGAEPDGFGPAWEGTFTIMASAYKYDQYNLYQYDTPSPVQAPGEVDAGVTDTFGTPQSCEVWASAAVEAYGYPDCLPDPWIDYGPCV